ncbi:hypothetical protein CBR_g34962 [Chara braunii]|uniref:CCHC-type domain-containing protein n=1 Tax=Chara braunii TaxID=69332 RepID=A0A388LK29_CHABU|nr:hypothetical protein CBR_g34962 [Chara braunii]|eukprot:GBG82593.1 hypothetical protein CBR_g34962 [Chara braunii]
MAGLGPGRNGCYPCGATNHWVHGCPHRGQRPVATGANTIPTPAPLLALIPPNGSAAASTANYAPSLPSQHPTGSAGTSSYGNQSRPNWWGRNQEKLDMCYNRCMEDREREVKRREEEQRVKKEKEEEEKRLKWKREREKFEADMGQRLEKKLSELGASIKGKRTHEGPAAGGMEDELTRLKRENEELKKKLGALMNQTGDGKVMYLQQEIMDLRKQVTNRQVNADAVFVVKQEISEMKLSTLMKVNLEKEVAGLRKEVSLLQGQNEQTTVEANQWRDEALRPGNKRGNVAVNTPGDPG